MDRQSYAVIGLGKFGFAVAETLAKAGYEVMAVDANEDIVQSIAGEVALSLIHIFTGATTLSRGSWGKTTVPSGMA